VGSPSREIDDCGILVRQFDALDNQDEGKPWESCPSSGRWCSGYADRWATSIINRDADKLYNTQLGGLVLSSDVSMFCVHQGDGNSMDPQHTCPQLFGDQHCIPGCYPPGEQCQDYHDYDRDWLCSYPPHLLKSALEHQLRRGVPMHNEVVVDVRSIKLPEAVVAVFFLAGSGLQFEQARDAARDIHARFVREFGVGGYMVPLLQLDLHGGPDGKTAFTLEETAPR
jgi:hypothetical protein